jgi:DNA-binding XRE family transcriptional regulator
MARIQNISPGRLRKHRRISLLKQIDVAKKFGFKDASIISRWERGEATPSLEHAFMLAKLYSTQTEELFYELSKACELRLFPHRKKKKKRLRFRNKDP